MYSHPYKFLEHGDHDKVKLHLYFSVHLGVQVKDAVAMQKVAADLFDSRSNTLTLNKYNFSQIFCCKSYFGWAYVLLASTALFSTQICLVFFISFPSSLTLYTLCIVSCIVSCFPVANQFIL